MTIFETYTGNAVLNNALMTIEALARLKRVSEITPHLLKDLYSKVDLMQINKRLKSYTMIFTKNGPLHNDKAKGDIIYESLFNTIVSSFENAGPNICELSGLRFATPFSRLYAKALEASGFSDIEIKNKDTNISRIWFPLVGGLGSDAQALPQAKFAIQIHPICIAILQFLPLSALLYKGGILLVDSSNFDLGREMVANHTKLLAERIQGISSKDSIENVRDFSKGDYLLKVLEILSNKEQFEEKYSDLNMWSFSNSGTGASCQIDRVPNTLIRKLQRLFKNNRIRNELKEILSNKEKSFSFIESLEGNNDWNLLYPNVTGSGKKANKYEGVTADFFEAYHTEIDKIESIPISKYLAGLVERYKSKSFDKLLIKTDAWKDPEYRVELYKVLIKATENGEWSLSDHISILDDRDCLPVANTYYQFHKLVHYFTQKRVQASFKPDVDTTGTATFRACKWMISIIQNDRNLKTIKSNLINPGETKKVGFTRAIFDAIAKYEIAFDDVIKIFYDRDYIFKKYGLNELLRIFFSQPEQVNYEFHPLKEASGVSGNFKQIGDEVNFSEINQWFQKIQAFAEDYQSYYYSRFRNVETGTVPYKKFQANINVFVRKSENFFRLLNEIVINTNQYLRDEVLVKNDRWTIEDLMTDPSGGSNTSICVFAIKFILKQKADISSNTIANS